MKVFGITGWKNSGKTTLITKIIQQLNVKGYSVSTIKHAHHALDIDTPGKDSYKHREAGAEQVLLATQQRWALLTEHVNKSEPTLDTLLAKLDPVDFVIVEGFKQSNHPKLAVVRPEHNPDPLNDAAPLVAIASSTPVDPQQYGCDGPNFLLDDIDTITHFIINSSEKQDNA